VPSDCAREGTTQHHRGLGNGHGLVSPRELVLVAVFEKTKRDGLRLLPTTFEVRQLTRGEFSLARLMHMTKSEFQAYVIGPGETAQGQLVGVARADVAALRQIPYVIEGTQPALTGRGVCVLDKVAIGDHDGHAALEYSESQDQLTPKQKNIARQQINADLAEIFGPVISTDVAFRYRFFWKIRVLLIQFMDTLHLT
jgi:hypothetical protein